MSDFYVTPETASVEIQKRWQNEEVKTKVREYLQGDIPEVFLREPRSILFRNICIPGSETKRFLECSQKMSLLPINLEYLADKFCTRNADKLQYGRLDVCEKMNKNNEPIIRSTRIIDFIANDNKSLADIATTWGEPIVDFFHASFDAMGMARPEIYDLSAWLVCHGKKANEYYKQFFALCIAHGVLCDNFGADGGDENNFFYEVVRPAFDHVTQEFGMKPLVVQIFSDEEIEQCDQWYFDAQMQEILNEKMKKTSNRLV
ncbi:MAG: hypothetical protein WC819_01895 [Parcubacteria group bacterium]|jgi:hypothetical protein